MQRLALRATRQLAKRQMTWINAWRGHRLIDRSAAIHG
jgi:tRNA A37 N6-isopentenylltransferase MiaA